MFSLLSSSSTVLPSDKETLKCMKASLSAVPSGLVQSSGKHGKKRSKIHNRSTITSKAFNAVASRPGPARIMAVPQIQAQLSYSQSFGASSATVPAYTSLLFKLDQFANYVEYTSLFDQYRIDEVEVWIEPIQSQSSVFVNVGTISTCVDLDDANTPSTSASVRDHPNSLVTSGITGHYHKWKPHMAIAAYAGAFTSYSNQPAGWIDSASPSVQHFGLKGAFEATSTVINYNITCRALFSFKSPGI